MRANFTNTLPVSVNTYNVPIMADFSGPVQCEVWDRTNALYVQDKWRPTKKLVDVGLRFETDFAWLPPSCSATNVFVEARCFSEINGVPDFKTVAPRFAAVYVEGATAGRRSSSPRTAIPGRSPWTMGCRSIQPSLPATRDRGRCVERVRRRDAISTETWCHR